MTPNWDFLLSESLLASVLPAEYAHFARPVRAGLTVFLSGLAEPVQAAILGAQAALPLTATVSQRLGLLARSSPVLQKLGQILARDQRLPLELRLHLRELESLPCTVPLETIQELLTQELGSLARRGVTLVPPAIAEASVAVVIPFQDLATQTRGVFKILKPGIEQRLEQELGLLERVGEHLDERCDELQIPHLDFQESFQQIQGKLWDEVQLQKEQRHLLEARDFFADEPRVQIPELLGHSTSRVTAMERITGGKVTGHGMDCRRQKRRLAGLIARALIGMPVYSSTDRALFHGDPHAGNLFLTDDDRLAILDWSLVGRLGERERVAIVQVILGAIMLDAGHIVTALEGLADRQRFDHTALAGVVQGWLQRIRRGQLPGLSWLVGLLDDATQNAQLRVGSDLMLFRKSLHTLEGIVEEIGEGRGQIDKVLLIEFLRQFALEWPQRWLRLPQSREFATRLSNLDLMRAVLGYPTTVARFWSGHAIDMLEAFRQHSSSAFQPAR